MVTKPEKEEVHEDPFVRNSLRESVSLREQRDPSKTPSLRRGAANGQDGGDSDMLSWAKRTLASYTAIKITNMSSAWRNGLGFCALIHSKYPEFIPYEELKAFNSGLNCRLALSASRLLGANVPAEGVDDKILNATTTRLFLGELRRVLNASPPVQIDSSEALRWRRQWYKDEKLFKEEFAGQTLFDDSMLSSSSATTTVITDDIVPCTPNRIRAKELISQAHQQFDLEEEDQAEEEDEEPSVSTTSSSTTRTGDGSSPSRRSSSTSALRDLVKIREELHSLEQENERISHEKNVLEQFLRTQESEEETKDVLPRYLQLVNEKNGLVRRQMQLNLFEKEALISAKQRSLNEELQTISSVADEDKTERMRERETALLQELYGLVNEKNELVQLLDNQEKAIQEDERIEEASQNTSLTTTTAPKMKSEEECVIQ